MADFTRTIARQQLRILATRLNALFDGLPIVRQTVSIEEIDLLSTYMSKLRHSLVIPVRRFDHATNWGLHQRSSCGSQLGANLSTRELATVVLSETIRTVGLVYTAITLKNPRQPELHSVEANALVDTGALHLCIPEHVAIQLRLDQVYEREVTTADGSKRLCPYIGPVEIRFGERVCFTGALVLGDEVLLGAVPMEDMDLVVSPATRTVTVNPASPNIPSSTVKAVG